MQRELPEAVGGGGSESELDALAEEIVGAMTRAAEAEESENWHVMLASVSRGVQLWKKGRRPTGPAVELELEEVEGGGWRAVVRWPDLPRLCVGAAAPSRRAARQCGKQEAAQVMLRLFEGMMSMRIAESGSP